MSQVEATAVALRESRFVADLADVRALLPGIDAATPPFTLIEYVDGIPRSAVGWPVQTSDVLRRELFRFVVTAVGRALNDSDSRDLDDLTLDGVREEPYFRELSGLLARSLAHGPELRLDSILWLYVSRLVARLLSRDDALLRELGKTFPDDVAKATQYLDELLRLKGSSPSRHAAVKDRALRALLARHDIALARMREPAADTGLHRLLVENRLMWTEQPDGLYHFFDLREAFLTRHRGFDLDTFLGLQKLVRAAVDDAWRKRTSGSTSLAERWLLEQFVGEPLLERASRLELAGLADTQEDDYPARVAVVASLQPRLASYVLHHSDLFQPSRAAAKRYDIGKDLLKQLKDSSNLASRARSYVDVVEDVLRWDFLNSLRGFVHPVTAEMNGWQEGNRRLRSSARVLELAHPNTLYSRRRHGTVVSWRLVGFEGALRSRTDVSGTDLPSGEDFEALCLRRILGARERLGVGGGRSDGFERGVGFDVFPRALDALRYALALRAALETEQHVQLGLGEQPAPNPFARALRVGMAAGDYVDVQSPTDAGRPQARAVGAASDDASALVDQPDGPDVGGRVAVDEYDPLEVFRATVSGGQLSNLGFVSNERAFREVLASVRLDGMTHSAADRDAVIAGRAVDFKNYAFELVFDDPVSRRVVLVRRIADPIARHGTEEPVYEYVAMTVEQFVSFHDRAADAARHQPVVRRSVPRAAAPQTPGQPQVTPGNGSAPMAARKTPSAPSVPDLAIPDAGAFMVGTASSSGDVLGDKLGLSFESKPSAEDSQGFLSGLFGGEESAGAAWPPSEGWLSESGTDLAAPSGLNEDFTSLVDDPTPEPAPEPPPTGLAGPDYADSSFDDFSLGDPRPVERESLPEGALFDFGAGGVMGSGLFDMPEPEADAPLSSSPAAPAAPGSARRAAPSLLGALDADFLQRLADAAPDVAPQVASREAKARQKQAPTPEKVRVARPDFANLFRDYVIFEIEVPGQPEVAIGRRYKDVLFDLHRFPNEGDDPRSAALDSFMRSKVRDNFVPRSLSYEEIPVGAGELEVLPLASLEHAFERVT